VEHEVRRPKTTIALEPGEVASTIESLIDVVPEAHDHMVRVDRVLELAKRNDREA
jgi:hypothetical protein